MECFGTDRNIIVAVVRELRSHALEIGLPGGDVILRKTRGLLQGRPESTDIALTVITAILRPLRQRWRAEGSGVRLNPLMGRSPDNLVDAVVYADNLFLGRRTGQQRYFVILITYGRRRNS